MILRLRVPLHKSGFILHNKGGNQIRRLCTITFLSVSARVLFLFLRLCVRRKAQTVLCREDLKARMTDNAAANIL